MRRLAVRHFALSLLRLAIRNIPVPLLLHLLLPQPLPLRLLLVERNMHSVAACEQLATAHGDALGPEFAALGAAVARLDFAKALKACDLLLDRLNPR